MYSWDTWGIWPSEQYSMMAREGAWHVESRFPLSQQLQAFAAALAAGSMSAAGQQWQESRAQGHTGLRDTSQPMRFAPRLLISGVLIHFAPHFKRTKTTYAPLKRNITDLAHLKPSSLHKKWSGRGFNCASESCGDETRTLADAFICCCSSSQVQPSCPSMGVHIPHADYSHPTTFTLSSSLRH